ncbi:MAG: PQQ-dependent sugar dehydrogenase [Fibrobacteria bacterium]
MHDFNRRVVSGLAKLACGALCLAATLGGPVSAQLPTGVTLVPFYDPAVVSFVKDEVRTVGMAEVPGKPEHFFVTDQMGAVYWLYPDTAKTYTQGQIKSYSKGTILDIKTKVKHNLRSEMGMWSTAFSPNFRQNRYFYIMYFGYNTKPSDEMRTDGYVNLERWTLGADYKTATRDTTIFSFYHEPSYGVSSFAFGPDGYVYIGTSVYSEDGWDTTTVARKVLRIDVDHPSGGKMYSIPADNPFAKSTNANVKKEIYAWGFRNVWSMSFDFLTGKLWAGDVGQDLFEEINLVQPGKNYGWADGGNSEPSANGYGVQGACPSGFSAKGMTCSGLAAPTWAFSHNGSQAINCIVVGPAFRGSQASPFYGYHFVTDVWRNQFWAIKEGSAPILVGQSPTSITTNNDGHNGIVNIAEDSYGNLYASMVSWHFSGSIGGTTNPLPPGQKMFHEIYRLYHAQLTPGTTAIASRGPGLPELPASSRLLSNAGPGSWVTIPKGFTGFEVRNLQGRRLWSFRGENGGENEGENEGENGARLPVGLDKGILQVRFLP